MVAMVAALVAQGLGPLEATALAVHLHGLAGDLAAERLGQISLEATALLAAIPDAFQALTTRPKGS